MVVIEPEKEIQPAPASRLAADHTATPSSPPPAAVDVNGNDSDGFETASERGVSDEDEDKEEGHRNDDSTGSGQHTSTEASRERLHKVLEEANEAKVEGNKLFGEGKYEEALLKYDAALQLSQDVESTGELRAICHSNRGVCFLKLGKYEDTVKECTKALELNPSYLKALFRRAEARERLENFEEAIADMKKMLELDPSNEQAIKSICRLEPLAAEKREKMKEEMIGKLKDMGNSLLGRFGMSMDNFKAVKDPNTGSYSMSFQK